jgi:hypothetical protein
MGMRESKILFLLVLKVKKEAVGQGKWWPPEARKNKEMNAPTEPKKHPADTLILAQ